MAVQIHLDYPPGTRQGNTCSACGAGHRMIRDAGERVARRERVVDFFITIDMEGFLLLCEQCVLEAAAALGWVSPTRRDVALQAAAERAVTINTLTAERDEARALLDALRAYDEKQPAPVQEVVEVVAPEPDPDPEPVVDVEPVTPSRKTKPRRAKITA